MKRVFKILSLFAIISVVAAQGGSFTNPALDTYASYFTRGVQNPGFWGSAPPISASPFNTVWDSKGFNQMYNLNSRSPYAGNRGTGFDTLTPIFNPVGPTRFDFVPTQSNFLPPGELGAYNYDVNEPRNRNMIQQYFRFFNRDLDRLSAVIGDNTRATDLSAQNIDRLKEPLSVYQRKYNTFFDGNDELTSSPAGHTPRLKVKTFFPPNPRNLALQDSFEAFKKKMHIDDNSIEQGKLLTPQLDRLQKLEHQLNRIDRKLKLVSNLGKSRKLSLKVHPPAFKGPMELV